MVIGFLLNDSFQFSHSVLSDSLQPHELQHTRPPCPSPTPGVHSNSCPSSRRCHPAISSCRPLLLLPPIPPSIRVFSNESTLHMRMGKTRDLFKKIRDTKGTFYAKMGLIKDRNGIDLTEAEDIKKRWQEYTKNCTKKTFRPR